ncbi:MAG: hypothetical protein VKI83_12120 [Synechococcaceae cyanobacterium]|nr:hypothetical protein [Synechococcaceae cyanobacterium]
MSPAFSTARPAPPAPASAPSEPRRQRRSWRGERALPAALLLAGLAVLSGCWTAAPRQRQAPPTAGLGISEAERLCYELGETATSRRQARENIRRCLKQLREQASIAAAPQTSRSETSRRGASPQAVQGEASDGWQRYSTCLLRRRQVSAAEGRRLRALPRWMLAAARLDPGSAAYQAARQDYEEALAELERLLPPQLRGSEPLIPSAVQTFMHCDPQAF